MRNTEGNLLFGKVVMIQRMELGAEGPNHHFTLQSPCLDDPSLDKTLRVKGGGVDMTPGCIAVCSWRRLLASCHLPLPFP